MNLGTLKLSITLVRSVAAAEIPGVAASGLSRGGSRKKNLTGQFIARDEEIGRWFKIENGRVSSGSGVLKNADVTVAFKKRRARRKHS